MKTAIVGDGIGGGYLYHLLKQEFHEDEIDVFGKKHRISCQIRPCAWMVNYPLFIKLGEEANIDFDRYVTKRFNKTKFQGKEILADVASINKPLLIQGLLKGAEIKYSKPDVSKYDRVIDATGKRAILPPSAGSSNNLTSRLYQCRYQSKEYSIPEALFSLSALKYVIPLGDGTAHIGFGGSAGSLIVKEKFKQFISGKKVACQCKEDLCIEGIRLPIVCGKVCGIGEAIGLVDPFSGVGIIPAMDSARALVEYFYDLPEYEKYIKREYSFMAREGRALRSNNVIISAFFLILAIKKSIRLIGFNPSVLDLVGPLRQAYLERVREERRQKVEVVREKALK